VNFDALAGPGAYVGQEAYLDAGGNFCIFIGLRKRGGCELAHALQVGTAIASSGSLRWAISTVLGCTSVQFKGVDQRESISIDVRAGQHRHHHSQ